MSAVFDAYMEFICADPATQSELWDKSIEALQKNPPSKFAPNAKPVYAEGMATQRVTLTKDELVKLRDLQGAAWGRYTKAYRKLDHAIQKIEEAEKEAK